MPKAKSKKQGEFHGVALDNDREDWMRFSLTAWDRAFGDNEPEYTSNMIKKPGKRNKCAETKPRRKKFKFDWEGELSDLADEFSSVELQHKAVEWR
ncbi:MAG: hypothetical protein ACREOI_05635 [bacterium]